MPSGIWLLAALLCALRQASSLCRHLWPAPRCVICQQVQPLSAHCSVTGWWSTSPALWAVICKPGTVCWHSLVAGRVLQLVSGVCMLHMISSCITLLVTSAQAAASKKCQCFQRIDTSSCNRDRAHANIDRHRKCMRCALLVLTGAGWACTQCSGQWHCHGPVHSPGTRRQGGKGHSHRIRQQAGR